MPAYPVTVPTAKLIGQYAMMSQDGMDPNAQPDLSPITGTVTLKCTAPPPVFYRTGSGPALGLLMQDHVFTFNAKGELTDIDGSTDIDILATNSAYITPRNFQWEASFDIGGPAGQRFKLPSFRFYAPAGTTVDLVAVTPVDVQNGTPVIQGPEGRDGSNVLPTDEAIAQALVDPNSASYRAIRDILVSSGATPYLGPVDSLDYQGLAHFPTGAQSHVEDPAIPGLFFIESGDGFIESPTYPGLLSYEGR